MDAEGIFALAFFVGLVGFVCFEAVQLAKGRVHWRGIARAALEFLIVLPIVILTIMLFDKLTDRFRLTDLEATVFRKWVVCLVLLVVWAPWSHYRATTVSRKQKLKSAQGELSEPDESNDLLPEDTENKF